MSHLTIKIHWLGPYTPEDVAELEDGNGLYLFTGKRKGQKAESHIQYFGITEQAFRVRFRQHHKLRDINRELGIWLGRVDYPEQHTRTHLETAESILVYFWQPQLNDRKKVNPPGPTTIISHWFRPDGQARINQKSIYRDLPDVISWDGSHWRTGNLTVWAAGE